MRLVLGEISVQVCGQWLGLAPSAQTLNRTEADSPLLSLSTRFLLPDGLRTGTQALLPGPRRPAGPADSSRGADAAEVGLASLPWRRRRLPGVAVGWVSGGTLEQRSGA